MSTILIGGHILTHYYPEMPRNASPKPHRNTRPFAIYPPFSYIPTQEYKVKEFKTLLPYLKKRVAYYLAGILFLLLTNAGQLVIPQILRIVVDGFSQGLPSQDFIVNWILILLSTALLIAGARVGWRFFIIGAARRIETDLRHRIFEHLLSLSSQFYGQNKTGDLMARTTNDLDAVRMSVGMALVAFTDGVFITVSVFIILFTQNPSLGIFVLLPLPLITVIILLFGGVVGKRFKKVQEEYSKLSGHVQESLTGIRVIKAFVQEEATSQEFDRMCLEYKSANMKLVQLWGLFFPIIGLLSGFTTLILLYTGGAAVMNGEMTPGEFTAYLSYLGMLVWPMLGMGFTVNIIQRGAASLKRINHVLQTVPDIQSPPVAAGAPQSFDLALRNLTYRYPDGKEDVLKGMDLEIPQGSFVGILGPTGSGKSTLSKILPRLLEAPEGTVFLDGRDIRSYELTTLRRSFSMVPQTTFLFSDTIKGNIGFGNPEADEALLREVSELSTISRDFDSFEKGWETLVGERGVTLSGGQKQRVALSRALSHMAPILILDDALSAVDVETEEKILDHFLETRRGKTTLLISHRVNTLKHCDTIVVLDDGRLTQKGSHEELINQEGVYREIYLLQKFSHHGTEKEVTHERT